MTQQLLARRDQSNQDLISLEAEMLGYSHADIGARLLEMWKLPATIWEPVLTHHNPQSSGEFMLAASAIHLADVWVNRVGIEGTSEKILSHFDPAAMALISVEPEALDSIGSSALQQTGAIVSQFSLH
ncbi:MAG: HDOD domain-containing protein [Pseudomonadota bacterium]